MKEDRKSQVISLAVTQEVKEKTTWLAEQTSRTLAGYVRQLLRVHIREYETLHGPIPIQGDGADSKL